MTFQRAFMAVRGYVMEHRAVLATITATALAFAIAVTAMGVTDSIAADEHARAEAKAEAAIEVTLVDYYGDALAATAPIGAQLAEDATVWATSKSPLLTSEDAAGLHSTADALGEALGRTPPNRATSAELRQLLESNQMMIEGAQARFDYFVDRAAAAAKKHLKAAPIASAASRKAVVDAIAALDAAASSGESVDTPFIELVSRVKAVDAAQAKAVAARAAAAARKAGVAVHAGSAAAKGSPAPKCTSDVLTCVNQIRKYYGLGTLKSNGTLNTAAQACANRMAAANSMTHSSRTPGFSYWGENIAYGYGSGAAVFNAWMNSPGHRANILNSHYHYMGLGHVASGNWWCQQFGS